MITIKPVVHTIEINNINIGHIDLSNNEVVLDAELSTEEYIELTDAILAFLKEHKWDSTTYTNTDLTL